MRSDLRHGSMNVGNRITSRLSRLLLAAGLGAWGLAGASDLPHAASAVFPANTCSACHIPHRASGPSLTTAIDNPTLCISCHTTNGSTGINTWSTTDQATVGTSGTSHRWDANATNSTYGAGVPASTAMKSRLVGGTTLQCSTCHDQHKQTNAPADPDVPAYPANAATTLAKRHFQRTPNSSNEMCTDCHTAWKQATSDSRTYTGTARSHPVLNQNATTPLVMNNAGSGASDATYKQVPHDFPIRVTGSSATSTTSITIDATKYGFTSGSLTNFVLRFTSGAFKNVPVLVTGNTNSGATNVVTFAALPAAPATADTAEIDRAAYVFYTTAYDTTTGGAASSFTDSSKNWPTTGNASPTAGAGSVTVLATPVANAADDGAVCPITSNTATSLTLGTCTPALTTTPSAGWVYAINWKLSGSSKTSAAGSTTTFVDSSRLWPANGIVGLQVRFLVSNFTVTVTSWNATTFTATFSPARSTAVASGETYQLEPAQVGPYIGTVAASPSPTTTAFTTVETSPFPATANALQNLMARFKSGTNRGYVARITASTANALTVVALPAAPASGDTFEIDLDGNTSNNVWLAGSSPTFSNPATGLVACTSCHGAHYADSDPTTYDDRPRTAGDGRLLHRGWKNGSTDEVCEGCHATKVHNSINTSSKYGAWGTNFTCITCHQPHNTNNVYLVKPQIARPADGAAVNVDFRDGASGQNPNAFINAANNTVLQTSGNGPCEACHLNTRNGSLYAPSVNPLGAGTVTVSGTTVTCSGTCNFNTLVTAAGWEFRMTGDPDTSWTRVSSATATTLTLAVAYPRTVSTAAAYQIANPRYRSATAQRQNLGSGRGVNSGDHYTTQCTGCHQHAQAFKAGESSGGVSCDGCHGTIFQGMNGTVAKTTKHTLGTTPATNTTWVDSSSINWYGTTTYNTGTAAFTNGSTAVTGTGTSWAAGMVGGLIQNSADGTWYNITAVPSATSIAISPAYAGTTASGAYSIDSNYSAGTATFTNASATVTGTGTAFAAGMVGGLIKNNATGIWYRVTAVASATSLTISANYAQPTATSVAYTLAGALAQNASTQRSCVNMCHGDHPHDLPGTSTTHENNAYADATTYSSRGDNTGAASQTRTTATRMSADFDNTKTNGGLCISCHRSPVNETHYEVSQSAYSASAHNYDGSVAPQSTYGAWQYVQHDGGVFKRNCTKCHADPGDAQQDSSIPFGAVHFSSNASLLSGVTNPATTQGTFNATQAATYVCYGCHGGTLPAGSTPTSLGTDKSGKNIAAQVAHERLTANSGHPTDDDATHNTVTEFAGSTFGAGLGSGVARHVNCLDCHEQHEAKAGLRTIGGASGNTIGGALQGAWGAKLSTNPAFWTVGASANYAQVALTTAAPGAGQDNLEASLCFKCHSSYSGTLPISPSSVGLPSPIAAGGFTETDTALEFNPANAGNWKTAGTVNQYDGGETAGSFHPVLADCSNNLGAITLTNLVTTNFAWSTTARNKMRCSDCHASDVNTDPVGPHGSAAKFILRGPNTTWTQATVGTTAGIFCWNCHSSSYANSRFSTHSTHANSVGVPCMNCHVAIVHGSMRPGLLSPGNGGCGVNGGTTCGPTSMNINVGGPVVACQNGNGAGTNCLATDNPPYNQAGTTQNKLRLAYYPANSTTDWGSTTNYCGCGNVNGGTGH